jgi:outer membrane immunogenic protein
VRITGVGAFAGVMAVAFASLSQVRAADLPGRGYAVASEFLTPTSAFDWSGPYIGPHLGYGWGQAKFTDPLGNPGWSLRNDVGGVIGGGQFGYNYHYAPWVFGFEFDVSGAGIGGNATDVGAFAGDHYGSQIHAIGTLTVRLGYAWANHLFYVKAGGAGADTRYEYAPVSLGDSLGTREDTTRWGWTVGVGWEYGITPNWSAKLEYDFIDFGKDLVFLDTDARPFSPTVDHQIHLFKVGANWRWNGLFNNGRPVAIYDGLRPGVY